MKVSHAIAAIDHALGGTIHPKVGYLPVLNEAGQLLVASRSWNWLIRYDTGLDYVATIPYLVLPSDFAELVGQPILSNQITSTARVGTIEELLERRQGSAVIADTGYLFAVGHRVIAPATTASPVLEVYPVPTANGTNVVTIAYRAGWTSLTTLDDSADLPIPSAGWLDEVYMRLCRAVASSYEKEEGRLEAINAIFQSVVYQAAIRRDAAVQSNFGPIRHGALSSSRSRYWYIQSGNVPDP